MRRARGGKRTYESNITLTKRSFSSPNTKTTFRDLRQPQLIDSVKLKSCHVISLCFRETRTIVAQKKIALNEVDRHGAS